jgi:hypothetical protein
MSTRIVFVAALADKPVSQIVTEEPSEVSQAFEAANGLPFLLDSPNVSDLYVNPANIAYWHKYG